MIRLKYLQFISYLFSNKLCAGTLMVLCQSALYLKKTEIEELQRAANISVQGVFSYLEAFMYFFSFLGVKWVFLQDLWNRVSHYSMYKMKEWKTA